MNVLSYPSDFVNKIILGDAKLLIQSIPDGVIDMVIIDPPYGLNKDGIPGDNDLQVFRDILPECYRVLKNDSFFITFFSIKFLPQLFIDNPFEYFWQIILYCPSSAGRSPIGFSKYMMCIIFKKGNPKIINPMQDIVMHTTNGLIEPDEGYIDHPTVKAKRFIAKLLHSFSNVDDIVLDTFIGSGTTAIACLLSNRRFIGFEIDEKYYNIAQHRIDQWLLRPRLNLDNTNIALWEENECLY